MKYPPRRWTLVLCIPLLAFLLVAPGQLGAHMQRSLTTLAQPYPTAVVSAAPEQEAQPGAADFAPPMSQDAADARVDAAQKADVQRRAALNPTPLEGLPSVQTVYMPPSKHHLSDRTGFLTFWRKNGGLLIFGYPISEEIVENGRIVQYFERAKFEYFPAEIGTPAQVQLALLGRELTTGRTFPDGAPEGGEIYFPETKHTLSGKFKQFWEKRGGLATFGFPISEPMEETSTIDGQNRIVQYFERAKFEYFPEELGGYYQQMVQAYGYRLAALREVQLADLGRQAAQRQSYAFAENLRLSGAPEWSPANYARRLDINLSEQQLVAYEGDIAVFQAPIATGRDGFNTPTGTYAIYDKLLMQDMFGSMGGESWYVPNIPWVQYVVGGVALHGTYWHDQWGTGTRMSHGCINLNIDDAQWLYEWASIGTQVDIHY